MADGRRQSLWLQRMAESAADSQRRSIFESAQDRNRSQSPTNPTLPNENSKSLHSAFISNSSQVRNRSQSPLNTTLPGENNKVLPSASASSSAPASSSTSSTAQAIQAMDRAAKATALAMEKAAKATEAISTGRNERADKASEVVSTAKQTPTEARVGKAFEKGRAQSALTAREAAVRSNSSERAQKAATISEMSAAARKGYEWASVDSAKEFRKSQATNLEQAQRVFSTPLVAPIGSAKSTEAVSTSKQTPTEAVACKAAEEGGAQAAVRDGVTGVRSNSSARAQKAATISEMSAAARKGYEWGSVDSAKGLRKSQATNLEQAQRVLSTLVTPPIGASKSVEAVSTSKQTPTEAVACKAAAEGVTQSALKTTEAAVINNPSEWVQKAATTIAEADLAAARKIPEQASEDMEAKKSQAIASEHAPRVLPTPITPSTTTEPAAKLRGFATSPKPVSSKQNSPASPSIVYHSISTPIRNQSPKKSHPAEAADYTSYVSSGKVDGSLPVGPQEHSWKFHSSEPAAPKPRAQTATDTRREAEQLQSPVSLHDLNQTIKLLQMEVSRMSLSMRSIMRDELEEMSQSMSQSMCQSMQHIIRKELEGCVTAFHVEQEPQRKVQDLSEKAAEWQQKSISFGQKPVNYESGPAFSTGMLVSVTQDVHLLEKAVRDCDMNWPNASSASPWTSNLGKSGRIMEVDNSDRTVMVSNGIGWIPMSALIIEHGQVLESEMDKQTYPAIAVGMPISITQDVQLLEKAMRDCDMEWPNASALWSWTSKLGKSGHIMKVDTSDGTVMVSNDIGWVPVGALTTEQGQVLEGGRENQPYPAVGMPISITQDVQILENAVRDCDMDWPNSTSGMPWTLNLGKFGRILELSISDRTAMVSNDIGWVPIDALITKQVQVLESEREKRAYPLIGMGKPITVTHDLQLLEKAVHDCDMDWPNPSSGIPWTSKLGQSGCILEVGFSDRTVLVSNDIGWVPIDAVITSRRQVWESSKEKQPCSAISVGGPYLPGA